MLAKKQPQQPVTASMSTAAHCALQAGVKLQLQFMDEPERGRFQVTVIGYVEGRSLMISAPVSNGHVLLLREGQHFIVRLLSGKRIIGFNSEVLKVYNNPFAYVHLKPPTEVEEFNVRNAYRVEMDVIATVCPLGQEGESGEPPRSGDSIAAKITNMSITGCQLQMRKRLADENGPVRIFTRIEVAGQERMLSLEADIRSTREIGSGEKKWQVYGVQFRETGDDKRLLLNCFVYEKLVKELFRE